MDRIVSLAPSVTDTIVALGGADTLVGITDHDTDRFSNPTQGAVQCPANEEFPEPASKEIPDTAQEEVFNPPEEEVNGPAQEVPSPTQEPTTIGTWLDPDIDAIVDCEPTVVFTTDALQEPTVETLRDRGLPVVHCDPRTLGDVLETICTVGNHIGRSAEARNLRGSLETQINAVADRPIAEPPIVYAEEWPSPPMAAGNWVPDVVRVAGGKYPYRKPGERSARIDPEAGPEADMVLLHYCGRGVVTDPSLDHLPAGPVVYSVHDNLLNRPGPALGMAIDLLADLFRDASVDDPRVKRIR